MPLVFRPSHHGSMEPRFTAGAPDSEMASHFCLDPHDPYAQSEALVMFEGEFPAIRLVSVIDKDGDDWPASGSVDTILS